MVSDRADMEWLECMLTHCLRFEGNEPFLRSSVITESPEIKSLFRELASVHILMQADIGIWQHLVPELLTDVTCGL